MKQVYYSDISTKQQTRVKDLQRLYLNRNDCYLCPVISTNSKLHVCKELYNKSIYHRANRSKSKSAKKKPLNQSSSKIESNKPYLDYVLIALEKEKTFKEIILRDFDSRSSLKLANLDFLPESLSDGNSNKLGANETEEDYKLRCQSTNYLSKSTQRLASNGSQQPEPPERQNSNEKPKVVEKPDAQNDQALEDPIEQKPDYTQDKDYQDYLASKLHNKMNALQIRIAKQGDLSLVAQKPTSPVQSRSQSTDPPRKTQLELNCSYDFSNDIGFFHEFNRRKVKLELPSVERLSDERLVFEKLERKVLRESQVRLAPGDGLESIEKSVRTIQEFFKISLIRKYYVRVFLQWDSSEEHLVWMFSHVKAKRHYLQAYSLEKAFLYKSLIAGVEFNLKDIEAAKDQIVELLVTPHVTNPPTELPRLTQMNALKDLNTIQ